MHALKVEATGLWCGRVIGRTFLSNKTLVWRPGATLVATNQSFNVLLVPMSLPRKLNSLFMSLPLVVAVASIIIEKYTTFFC